MSNFIDDNAEYFEDYAFTISISDRELIIEVSYQDIIINKSILQEELDKNPLDVLEPALRQVLAGKIVIQVDGNTPSFVGIDELVNDILKAVN